MKNQNDLILRVVAVVLALIACGVIAFNQPQPFQPADPERVPDVKVELPAGTVVRTNGLPGGSDQNQAGGPQMGGGAPAPAAGGGMVVGAQGREAAR